MISLLVGAIFFVKQTIEEFLENNTVYITTQEPLTPNDLPTITMRWRVNDDTSVFYNESLSYGKDFVIELKMIEGDMEALITLFMDE